MFLLDFDRKPTFNGIQIPDKQTLFNKSNASEKEENVQKQSSKKPVKSQARKTIKATFKSMIKDRDKALIT